MTTNITVNQASEIISKLHNSIVSRVWRGYGSAIFLEIGKLDEKQKGQFTLSSATGWSLYSHDKSKLCSYESSDWKEIDNILLSFQNTIIDSVQVENGIIRFNFSDKSLEIKTISGDENNFSLHNRDNNEYLIIQNEKFYIEKGD